MDDPIFNVKAHDEPIHMIKWDDNEGYLYSGSYDGTIKKWKIDFAGVTLQKKIADNIGKIHSLYIFSEMQLLATVVNGCLVGFLDTESGGVKRLLQFKSDASTGDAKSGFSIQVMQKRRELFVAFGSVIDVWTLPEPD